VNATFDSIENVSRANQFDGRRARYQFVIAGTICFACLAMPIPAWADFSAAHFKRIWQEEFGSGLLDNSQPTQATPQTQSFSGSISSAPVPFTSQQPHPAVVRVVVPEGEATSFGSGTLVDVREKFGMVITNWHVVRDAKGPIEVIFPGGFTSKARALKVDADWDLAALVIWRPPVEPVKIAALAPLAGDQLTICGYGPGVYRSATGRCTQYYSPKENLPQQMVELNVEARQGDSGGPIFNSRGELAGVLFGAGQGTTLGSFGGRVDAFLASLAPDIGGQTEGELVPCPTSEQLARQPSLQDVGINGWQSRQEKPATKPTNNFATASLLKPPTFEELHQTNVQSPVPQSQLGLADNVGIDAAPHTQFRLFDQVKSGLAAIGLFSIVVMMLKAAG
jgi:hypothetical protein